MKSTDNALRVGMYGQEKADQMAALDAYVARTSEATELLAYLTAYMDDYAMLAPETINWADVGSMSETVRLLHAVKQFIAGEDEPELPGSYESYDLCHRFG